MHANIQISGNDLRLMYYYLTHPEEIANSLVELPNLLDRIERKLNE